MNRNKTALLLSGGIDSAALAHWKRPDIAITINYGQRSAEGELRAAEEIAKELGIQQEIISIDCSSLGTGDLSGKPHVPNAPASEWWPFRNQLLVTLAATRMISLGANTLMIGSVKSDSFHVDGRAEFFDALNRVVKMQEGDIEVCAPASMLTALELVEVSKIPRAMLGWTHSCHRAPFACGRCRGCNKHAEIMRSLGYAD